MVEHIHQAERALALFPPLGIIRARDLAAQGIASETLRRLVHSGKIERVSRGSYRLATAETTAHHTLVSVSARVPHGIVCLLSALQFYELTTQVPFEVWLALDPHAHKPIITDLPVRIVRFSGAALTEGVTSHQIEGVTVRIYSIEKTLADCFKYRSTIGLDVALEALRNAWRQRRISLDTLWHMAHIDRVAQIMRPYVEALEVFA